MVGLRRSYDLHVVEMTLESVEPIGPYPSIGIEPRIQFDQGLETNPVHPALGIGSDCDQPCRPEHPQVLGHARLGNPQR